MPICAWCEYACFPISINLVWIWVARERNKEQLLCQMKIRRNEGWSEKKKHQYIISWIRVASKASDFN